MLTIRDLIRAAVDKDCQVVAESEGRWTTFQIEAPLGMRFVPDGVESLRVEWLTNDRGHKQAAIENAIERLRYVQLAPE